MSAGAVGEPMVIVEGDGSSFVQRIKAGAHELVADEPVAAGGGDAGPDPYRLLLAALGSCTSMTITMYARRKQWPVTRIRVELSHAKVWTQDCAHCDTREGRLDRVHRSIQLEGDLSADQRRRLIEIAEKCPVHRTLASTMDIVTRLMTA
ncbi:MAG TPA: OsmC family protein [Vicinamibacterales bacterium]|nr:OsmC family protein [Vicinamibacterales bacterium]